MKREPTDNERKKLLLSPKEAMEWHIKNDPDTKIYTAYCAICDSALSQKWRFFRRKASILRWFRRRFHFCDICGGWVCDSCYVKDNGARGMCKECAEAKATMQERNRASPDNTEGKAQ